MRVQALVRQAAVEPPPLTRGIVKPENSYSRRRRSTPSRIASGYSEAEKRDPFGATAARVYGIKVAL